MVKFAIFAGHALAFSVSLAALSDRFASVKVVVSDGRIKVVRGGTGRPAPTPSPKPTPSPTPVPTPTPSHTPAPSARPVVVSEGDSLSVFWGGNHTGIYAASRSDVTFHGRAVGGSGIGSMNARFAADAALKPSHVTVLIGANDLGDGSYASPEAWLDALWAYTARWRAMGVEVAVGTVPPICLPQHAAYHKRHAERRELVNAVIRQAAGTRIDAVVDFAADPVIGPDQAACDTRLYGDGLHPTGEGQRLMAAVYKPVVDRMVER